MKAAATISSLNSAYFRLSSRLYEVAGRLRGLLAFSAADERIASSRDLCIAVERSGISAAYGTRSLSRVRIKGTRQYPSDERGYPQPKDLASAAVLAMRELGVSGAGVTLSLPKAWAIITTEEFPSAVKENIPDAVAYELDRLVPFSAGEALYDFTVLGEGGGKITIAVAAARADLVNAYLDALRAEGIEVGRVTINLSGIGSLCRVMGKEGPTPLFIEVREDGYEGALYVDGSPAWVMSGDFNSPDSRPDDRAKTEMVLADTSRLIDIAKGRGLAPHAVALFRERTAGLKEMFRMKIGLPVTFLGESGMKPRLPGTQKDIPYAAVGGVLESLNPKAKKPDLLAKGRHERAKTPWELTAVLALSMLVLWVVSLLVPIRIGEERLAEFDRRIKLMKPAVRDAEVLRKSADALVSEIAAINAFREKTPMSLAILRELTTVFPKSAWLTRVRINGSTVEVEGYAASATELLPRLEASKLFRRAEFASPTFRDMGMNADRFSIKMEIKGPKGKEGAHAEK